jgi:hypothetical protein
LRYGEIVDPFLILLTTITVLSVRDHLVWGRRSAANDGPRRRLPAARDLAAARTVRPEAPRLTSAPAVEPRWDQGAFSSR